MAIVEINGYTGAKAIEEILNPANIIFYGDFTSTDNLVKSGASVTRVNDKMGGNVYGMAQGFWSQLSVGSSGYLGWDPRTSSNSGNTWFRMFNLSTTNSSGKTILFIGALASAGSVIVTAANATSDNRGYTQLSTEQQQRASSGTTYYRQIHNLGLLEGQTFASSSRVVSGNPNVSNVQGFVNGVEYPDTAQGTSVYNAYKWDAIGQGRSTTSSTKKSPFIHEIIYYNGQIKQTDWNNLMSLYITPKYGL